MSWIKPNFLWMMYRSGWGTKEGQEVTLAVWLRRAAFDAILRQAVHSTFVPEVYADKAQWQQALAESSVRLQWDPDHDPSGAKQQRRAIQLGLRGETLAAFGKRELVEVIDLTAFVAEQRDHTRAVNRTLLLTPREDVYPVSEEDTRRRLGLSSWP